MREVRKTAISVSLSNELIVTIDKERGLATRSAYINSILNKKLMGIQDGK